jgi:hypothetical protein
LTIERFDDVCRDFAPAAGVDVTMLRDKKDTVVDREALLPRLRELIEALDRRVPHLEREGEIRIARQAEALRQKAQDRIAELGLTCSRGASPSPRVCSDAVSHDRGDIA